MRDEAIRVTCDGCGRRAWATPPDGVPRWIRTETTPYDGHGMPGERVERDFCERCAKALGDTQAALREGTGVRG